MTTSQPAAPDQPQAPAPPAAPGAPSARTGVPEDLARQLDDANKAVEEAARRAELRAATAGGQDAAARVDVDLAGARAAVAGQAAAAARAGHVSVIRGGDGRIVVTGRDGRTVTIDPKAGLDEDAVQNMVQTALEPPRSGPEPWDRGPPESVVIVAIVFTFLFLMTAVISIARAVGRRASAGAGAQQLPPDLGARLARIEQGVEAVAIEVERVSEGQRYSARLLSERLPEAPPDTRAAVTAEAGRVGEAQRLLGAERRAP
jgi:hypothetical protein